MIEYTVRNSVKQYVNKSLDLVFSRKSAYITFEKELAQEVAERANEKYSHICKFEVYFKEEHETK